jgi:hypothetical protein
MPRLAMHWLHLACLWTLAICLPVFQVLSKSPDWLIAEHAGFPDLPLVAALYVLVPPTVGIALEWVAYRFSERAGSLLHLGAVAVLVGAYVLQLLKDEFDPKRRSLYLAALAVGALFAWGYRKGRFLPSVLTVLSPVTAVVLVWFLAFSGIAPRAWGNSAGAIDAPRVRAETPVVMVIFDEFSSLELLDRRGGIDAGRFPHLAALAREGTWYRHATTVADATITAVPAIVTGRWEPNRQPVEEEHPRNLFLYLRGQYGLNATEPITYLCTFCDHRSWTARTERVASSFWDLTKQRVRRGDPAAFLGVPYRTIDHRAEAFRRWIAGIRGGRTLNFIHIQFPHTPWWYTADGRQYTNRVVIPELDEETWTTDKAAVDGYLRRYVEQLRFLDRLVGELRRSLVRRGIWDDALVVLVADHGVAFVPGASRRFVSLPNFAEIASVPLFVKAPHQRRGRTSDELARTIDVVPTIGDYLGVRWPAQGRSLRRPVHRSDVVVSTFNGRRADAPRGAYESLRARAIARLRADLRSP